MSASLIDALRPFAGSFDSAPSLRCLVAGIALAAFAAWRRRSRPPAAHPRVSTVEHDRTPIAVD
jgi:hypothetical protein